MTRLRLPAAGLLLASAAIHLYLVPEHTNPEHQAMGHAYIGQGFLFCGVALAVLGLLLVWAPDPAVWDGAALLCAAMTGALVWSRVGNLPHGYHEPWQPLAVWSLACEVGFLACWLRDRVVRHQLVAPIGRMGAR